MLFSSVNKPLRPELTGMRLGIAEASVIAQPGSRDRIVPVGPPMHRG
jgi:hypothetical protein